MHNEKKDVHDFWNQASCGEALYLSETDKVGYAAHAKARYELEGEMIFGLAQFEQTKGLKVLEVGVGLGADHQKFAEAGAERYGIDLTERAIEHTQHRFGCLRAEVAVDGMGTTACSKGLASLVYSQILSKRWVGYVGCGIEVNL